MTAIFLMFKLFEVGNAANVPWWIMFITMFLDILPDVKIRYESHDK